MVQGDCSQGAQHLNNEAGYDSSTGYLGSENCIPVEHNSVQEEEPKAIKVSGDVKSKTRAMDQINTNIKSINDNEINKGANVINRNGIVNAQELNLKVLDLIVNREYKHSIKKKIREVRVFGLNKKIHSEVCTNDVPHGRFIDSFSGSRYYIPPAEDHQFSVETWKTRQDCLMLKNLLSLGMALMVHYIAVKGANNLQSSINAEEGLGTAGLTAYYGGYLFSSVFLPPVVISWLGCKLTLAVSILAYMPYIGAQFYPNFYTFIPGGLLAGLAAGPLWGAQGTYMSHIADTYSKTTGISKDIHMGRCFGIFYMIYQMSQIWGNLISSAVLSDGVYGQEELTDLNITSEGCGAKFCPSDQMSVANLKSESPPVEKIFLITAIYCACVVFACIIVIFGIDSLNRSDVKEKSTSGLQLLVATVRLLGCKEQMCLLTITAWHGVQDAFIAADFTASYVSCAWGIRHIGYVMICYGIANSAAAVLGGYMVKLTGRLPVVIFATVVHVGIVATLLIWEPNTNETIMFFAMAALWGATDGVFTAQINAMYGILFPGKEEAAYSSYRLWEGLGYIVAYGYSNALCTGMKLYSSLGILLVGVSGYVKIELDLRSKETASCSKS